MALGTEGKENTEGHVGSSSWDPDPWSSWEELDHKELKLEVKVDETQCPRQDRTIFTKKGQFSSEFGTGTEL